MTRANDRKTEAEAISEAERIIADYPRRELVVEVFHETRDMTVFNRTSDTAVIPFNKFRKGVITDATERYGGGVEILDFSEERTVLRWEGKEYEVKLGEQVKTASYAIENPYLSYEGIWVVFKYRYVTLEDRMFDILKEICDKHAREHKSYYPETTGKEILALRLLDEVIKEGCIELYVLKALLCASNDWSTGIFVRPSLFREILLEGIEKGCLAPENEEAWSWIETAAGNNDPSEFMDDMERWYDILATAAGEGNGIALDIMNTIWEPEQIIEED